MLGNKKFGFVAVLFCVLFCAALGFGQGRGDFYPSKVRDISDRKYEPAVIELLDSAKKSIVISMYIIMVEEVGPVRLLMKDLEEALGRGVSVDIYLNTRFAEGRALNVGSEEVFNILRQKGAKVFRVTPSVRMHDKLIITDSRYVVMGSANWSVSSLKDNYESVTLIDSPGLAEDMLIRLRRHTLEGDESSKTEKPLRAKRPVILNENSIVLLSSELLNNKDLFSYMVTERDSRAMDTYLLLKVYAIEQGSDEYFLSLEQLALDLDMPVDWSDTALRRQVIKVLKKLKSRYKLIDVNFDHGKDAWVAFKDLPGDTFEFKGEFLNPGYLSSLSQPAKFTLLIKALLEKEGTTIDSFTLKELSKRFDINAKTLAKGLKETSIK